MKAVLFDKDGLKLCPNCKHLLPNDKFNKSSNSKSGYSSWCSDCSKTCISQSAESKREYAKNFKMNNPISSWITTTLSGHKYKGYILHITHKELYDYVVNKKHCELCGKELMWGNTPYNKHNSPSLDRKNNENVITINNIMLLCNKCNTMKQNLSYDELMNWCDLLLSRRIK